MTVSQTREAIAVALETVPMLTVYREWPSQVQVPAALVEQASGQYRTHFQGGLEITFGVILLVSGLQGPGAWMGLLDAYLEPVGASSIDAALRRAAGNSGCSLASFENPGAYDVLGKQYYGVHLTLGAVYL